MRASLRSAPPRWAPIRFVPSMYVRSEPQGHADRLPDPLPAVAADEGSQDLHHRPVELGRLARDPFRRVDRPDPEIQLVAVTELVDGLHEAVGQLSPAAELDA